MARVELARQFSEPERPVSNRDRVNRVRRLAGHRLVVAEKPRPPRRHLHRPGQYTSIRFTEHLALEEIAPSIGTVGDAYDNALVESIIGLYKTECIRPGPFHPGPLRTIADVEYATMAWVDWWNNRRLHSSLGMLTPDEHEQAHYAALTREPQPV